VPTRTVVVGSSSGLHARPAALFVAAAAKQPVPVTISTDGARKPVPARSMLGVLSLGAKQGTQVTLAADGEGAEGALDELAALLARDLDAPDA
jgi:phosphocarrier protein HPr